MGKLCDLRDIARDLDRNVKRSWGMILVPNCFAIVGAFTMGFGIMTSVVTNNLSALFALGNGLLPLRKIAAAQAENLREQEKRAAAARPLRREEPKAAGPEPMPEPEPLLLEPRAVAIEEVDAAVGPKSPLGECLYERPLRRAFDDSLRGAILAEANRRRMEIPMPAEFEWDPSDPVLTLRSPLITFKISFAPDNLAVHAKVSMVARPLVTNGNRQKAIQLVENVAGQFDL